MNIREILVKALEELDGASVPEDLRVPAFEKVVDLLSRSVPAAQPDSGAGEPPPAGAGSATMLSGIAETLGVPEPKVAEVLNEEDGNLEVIVGVRRLDASNSGATKELALLVAGGRQIAGIEEWTSLDTIRATCDHFGKYDSANYAKTLKGMDDVFGSRGSARQRQVKLNREGQEQLTELVNRLSGGDD